MDDLLSGIVTALLTPFRDDGARVDEAVLRELVTGAISGGVSGLAVCGSTGEFASLDVEERKRVVEIVIDAAAGRVPVICNTGSTRLAEVLDLSRHAESAGVSAIMAVQPYYEPMQADEVFDYFRSISSAVNIPVVIYNIPSCSGTNIVPALASRMSRALWNIRYIKDSSGDFAQLLTLICRYSDDITTLIGWDTLTFSALALGCKGAILGAANIVPEPCVKLYELVRAGRHEEAQGLWRRLYPLIEFLGSAGYIASVKAGARLRGFAVGDPRPPYRPLSPQQEEKLRHLLIDAGALDYPHTIVNSPQ